MNRCRLLIVASVDISFALGATAFRALPTSTAPVGSLAPAAPMLEPRCGHSANPLTRRQGSHRRRHAPESGLL